MPKTSHRKVQEAPGFAAEFRKLFDAKKEADEILDGVVEILSNRAEFGKEIDGTPVWCELASDIPNGRLVGIYYTFDNKTVTLVSAKSHSIL